MDEDLGRMSREQLLDEVKKLRQGIREHRDSTGQEPLLASPGALGTLAGEDRSDSCSAGLAAVPARLLEVSPVA